jgi:hypothetical protein
MRKKIVHLKKACLLQAIGKERRGEASMISQMNLIMESVILRNLVRRHRASS